MLLMGIVAFPFFLLLNTAALGFIILGTALIAIAHSMQYGPQSSYIAENFPTGLAYAGSGLGYQAASLIAGGPAPLLATWMLPTFGWQAIAVYIIACVVITLAAAALLALVYGIVAVKIFFVHDSAHPRWVLPVVGGAEWHARYRSVVARLADEVRRLDRGDVHEHAGPEPPAAEKPIAAATPPAATTWLSLTRAAISSRSALESERVERPRIFWTNLLSSAVTAGSVCGPTERPRVSGFFSGASARTI